MATPFQLIPNAGHDIIVNTVTALRVHVFFLKHTPFKAQPNEIHLFGNDQGTLMAFETEGVSADTALELAPAINWYAQCRDRRQMEVSPFDPRPVYN
jgi:hypothetical protein